MAAVRFEDRDSGKTFYLHSEKSDAEALAIQLGHGHLERFTVIEHSSQLGWFVKDKESGRVYDAQGLAQ